jgi:hypothetical protein
VCDLDNEPTISVAQVHVTVDGQERTFDLCEQHLEAFRAAVAPFVPGGAGAGRGGRRGRGAAKSTGRAAKSTGRGARKATAAKATATKATATKATATKAAAKATATKARAGRPAKATRRAAAGGASDTAAVRAWAREQGIAVPESGRLGRDLIERYQQATSGSTASA